MPVGWSGTQTPPPTTPSSSTQRSTARGLEEQRLGPAPPGSTLADFLSRERRATRRRRCWGGRHLGSWRRIEGWVPGAGSLDPSH